MGSSNDENRSLQIKSSDIEISNEEKKIKKYIPLSRRQDKPDSALWLIKQHNILKDSQIAKLVGITKNSVTSIRNKSYWNYNNLNPKDPVALNLFTQKMPSAIERVWKHCMKHCSFLRQRHTPWLFQCGCQDYVDGCPQCSFKLHQHQVSCCSHATHISLQR